MGRPWAGGALRVLGEAVGEVTVKGLGPGAVVIGAMLAAALVTGLLANDLGSPMQLAGHLLLVLLPSGIAHEAAHLVVVRAMLGREAGSVEAGLFGVSVRVPAMRPWGKLSVSVAGPLVGGAVAGILMLTPIHTTIAGVVVMCHLVNLLPFFPDGRLATWALVATLTDRPP